LTRRAPPLLMLDACCVINLLASAREIAILTALPHRCGVVGRVLREGVLRIGDTDGARSLQPLADQGLLDVLELEGNEEEGTFISLAMNLDDGEAATGALAFHRSAILATDDAKAIRILTAEPYHLEIVGTPWLLERWHRTGVASSEVRETLLRIQEIGRFLPPKRDPLREWWMQMTKG
jgi:predicted nucleic acid-binding protein